jgi:membrane protease YdiL (CAAX protease family)
MGIYRKNVKMQMVLFIAFIILGVNVFLQYALNEVAPWYRYVMLGISVIFIGIIIVVYKSQDAKIIEIKQTEFKRIRILLYAYFFVYVADIVMTGIEAINQQILSIIASILLIVIAGNGFIIHSKLLNKG